MHRHIHDFKSKSCKSLGPRCFVFATIFFTGFPSSAVAHHSYAMFDRSTPTSTQGTVAKVEWTNPHVFVWVYVPQANGGNALYSFESGSVSALRRAGWSSTTLRVGEKITVHYFPLRNGGKGGSLFRVVHANGKVDTADPNAPGGKFAPSARTDK